VFAMAGVGVVAGVMLGSYVGLVLGHPQRRVTRDWSHLGGTEGEVLLIVDPKGRPDEAAAVLTSHATHSAGPPGGPG